MLLENILMLLENIPTLCENARVAPEQLVRFFFSLDKGTRMSDSIVPPIYSRPVSEIVLRPDACNGVTTLGKHHAGDDVESILLQQPHDNALFDLYVAIFATRDGLVNLASLLRESFGPSTLTVYTHLANLMNVWLCRHMPVHIRASEKCLPGVYKVVIDLQTPPKVECPASACFEPAYA
jgi:hypothetical protein